MKDTEPKGDSRIIKVFLDDETKPFAEFRPPVKFVMDTTKIPDGKHRLKIVAKSSNNVEGVNMVILSHIQRREHFAVVFDLRGTRAFTSPERQLFWAFIKTHRLLLDRYCLAVMVVTGDRLRRRIVTALSWLVTMPFVVKTYPTMEAGRVWLRGIIPQ
jgi:hypothetical protein